MGKSGSRCGLAALLVACAAQGATSQGVVDTILGEELDGRFGSAVAGLGDVDGDGVPDIAVGADPDPLFPDLGAVHVVSGRDRAPLWAAFGENLFDGFGTALADAGDVNGDGVPDLAVGAPETLTGGRGFVRLFSGADGTVLSTLPGNKLGDAFGLAVAGLGDIDGDGHADVAIGAPGVDTLLTDVGRVRAWSGADGSVLWTVTGSGLDQGLGAVVAALGDLDGDGVSEVGISDTQSFSVVSDVVHVHDGATGAFLHDLVSASPGERFGSAVAGAGDVDHDGVPDVAVGARDNATFGSRAGAAYAISGDDGSVIHAVFGPSHNALLGTSVDGAVDLDADGWADFVAGAPFELTTTAGEVWLVSGRDGSVTTRVGDLEESMLGTTVASLGDLDGDGFDEVLAGDPVIGANGEGLAKVLSLRLSAPPIDTVFGGPDSHLGLSLAGVGDLDGDGVADVVASGRGSGIGDADGLVRAISAADRSTIWEWTGPHRHIAPISDLDADGIDDVLVQIEAASIVARSGVDGAVIRSFDYPPGLGLSEVVGGAGDVDGDGVEDVIAGSALQTVNSSGSAGAAAVWSGATGAVIHELYGEIEINEGFASDVDGAGDLDGDGFDDLLVGASGTDSPLGGSGRVWAISGVDGSTLFQVDSAVFVERLGRAVEGFVDITGDGIPEVLAGAPSQANFGGNPGRVYCFSGADGALVWDHQDKAVGFGDVIQVGGDADGDGVPDVLVLSRTDHTGGLGRGATVVLSGATGDPLGAYLGPNAPFVDYPLFGFGVPIGDIDGDGVADVAVGAAGVQQAGDDVGAVSFFSGRVSSWTGLGQPTPGTWGTPALWPEGELVAGQPFTLHLGGFLQSAPVTLIVGLSEAGLPFKGGVLVPSPDLLFGLLTDGDGAAALPAVWPLGLPPGLALWLQAWMADAAGPKGFSASNGLKAAVP